MGIDKLIAQLASKDAAVRERSARQLGNSHSSDAVMPLIPALYDPDRDVRRAAVEALGNLRDLRAVKPLLQLIHDDDFYEEEEDWLIADLVEPIILNLGAQVADELVKFADDLTAQTILARLGDTRAFEPLMTVVQHIQPKSQNFCDRKDALRALGQLRDARALDTLIAYVNDEALWQISLPFTPTAGVDLRLTALHALGNFDDPRAISVLTQELLHPSNQGTCLVCAHGLHKIGSPAALDILLAFCKDKRSLHRVSVLRALIPSKHSQVAELFEQILHDPEDTLGWHPALDFFWDIGRFPELERLRLEVPLKPASVIETYIRQRLARS